MEKTFFASPERAEPDDLKKDILTIAENPVVNELLKVTNGLLAVLNAQRQILTVNETFLEMLGFKDVETAFGLRPGEFIQCVYAEKGPGGCGTSEYCLTCGAAIAIVSSLTDKELKERTCAVKVKKKDKTVDMYFKVRCSPIYVNHTLYLLLFLKDISKQQEWANMERVFFHDINNIIYGILGRSELLTDDSPEERTVHAKEIFKLSRRLSKEIEIQKSLSQSELRNYSPVYQNTTVKEVLDEIENIFKNHIAARGKSLVLPGIIPDISFRTDISLLLRILSNMVLNALEASGEGDNVKIYIRQDEGSMTFSVWNRLAIPEDISKRIFQRHFTTKNDLGRGLGTYSMKFFGEEILDGKMDFTTSEKEGTIFSFRLSK